MIIWIDAQLSPVISKWIQKEFSIDCSHVMDIGLLNASDEEIFFRARKENIIVMSKDIDFVNLLEKYNQPPKVIWLTCGNTSNDRLKQILKNTLQRAFEVLQQSESLVEIN
jgi:predicted nuclease of predicted toxin-antitoxin system